MSFEKADLEEKGLGDHVIVLNESTATVAEAAHALGVDIAKTLLDGPFLFAFRLLADIHPALGSGGCFQLLQGQLDGGVIVARRKDIFPLLRSYSVMAQTRAGRPVAPSMRG